MYNSHITLWKLNKNFKASEKQAVIDSADPFLQPASITTSSVPPHRLARYAKEHRKQARKTLKANSRHSSELDVSQTSNSCIPQSFHNSINVIKTVDGQHNVFINAPFVYSPPERASELFFMQMREYIQVRLQLFTPHSQIPVREVDDAILYNVPPSQLRLRDHLVLASKTFALRETVTRCNWLDKACKLARSVFEQAHWRPLNLFATVHRIAVVDPQIGKFTARFLANMAQTVYPNSQHCVVQLFRLFSQIEQQDSVLELACQIAIDSVREMAPENYMVQSVMQSWVIDSYDLSRMYHSALRIAEQHKDFCSARFGESHSRTRAAIFKLLRAYMRFNDFNNAYEESVTLLRTYEENYIPIDDVYLTTCTTLGNCCMCLGRFNAAMHYYSIHSDLSQQLYNTFGPSRDIELNQLEWSQHMIYNMGQKEPQIFEYAGVR